MPPASRTIAGSPAGRLRLRHGIRADRDRDPRRRADRRGLPAGRPRTPDAPAWTTTPRPARRSPGRARRQPSAHRRSSSPTPVVRRTRRRPRPHPVELPPAEPEPGLVFETPPPSAGRLVRLRSRLARSQSSLGRGLLTVLAREKLTEDDWEEVEETLLAADVGVARDHPDRRAAAHPVAGAGHRVRHASCASCWSRELTAVLGPDLDRTLGTDRHDGLPGVVLVVGVNGAGKTTTVGKIARVLVGDGKSVVLGAADTFRAAAADQLETWGERVGVLTVRGREGGDPASVAFEAVRTGVEARGRHRRGRHRRPAAHQVGPDGRAGQGQAGRGEAGARSPRCCSCSTRRPARTASSRPACSPRR